MSEPVLKQRPTIDLDDFERRLRQASASPSHRDDPLAELARLVGEPYDPVGDVFAQERPHAHAYGAAPAGYADMAEEPRAPGYAPDVPRLFGDFSAIEAGLRGVPSQPQAHQPGYGALQQEAGYVQAGQLPLDNDGEWTVAAPGEGHAAYGAAHGYAGEGYGDAAGGQRSLMRRPMTLMAASIAIGVIGIGAAFALKGRVASSPREVKTIMADATPTKIQPPPETDAAPADAAFGKGNGAQPSRLVSREEQPIDVGQAVQDNVARAARANVPTDASSVPVPPPPGQAQGAADPIGAQVQGFGLAEMPAPKRVRVVAVRPDGSIVPGDEAAQRQPASAPAVPAARDNAAKDSTAKAATPKAALGKTTSRVATRAADKPTEEKTIGEIAADGDDAPKPARKAKAQRVAAAETDEAAAAPEPSAEGGNFAVQLAAPTSESDAKAASSRFSKKFSDTLGGRHIAIRKAENNGKSVYRVRVSSLSRSEANSLCDKLKADGGSCFVAKN